MAQMKDCKACGERKPIKARGWCSACYARWLAHGKPETVPAAAVTTASQQLRRIRHYTSVPAEWNGEQTRAARQVAAHASDQDECRVLLQAIGLLPSGRTSADLIGGAA
jgi:hypothetical protein